MQILSRIDSEHACKRKVEVTGDLFAGQVGDGTSFDMKVTGCSGFLPILSRGFLQVFGRFINVLGLGSADTPKPMRCAAISRVFEYTPHRCSPNTHWVLLDYLHQSL